MSKKLLPEQDLNIPLFSASEFSEFGVTDAHLGRKPNKSLLEVKASAAVKGRYDAAKPATSKDIDFEKLLQSDNTVKMTSTPDRLKYIEVKKAAPIRLEAKPPIKYQDLSDEDDELLGIKKKKKETVWDFLRNTGPEDLNSIVKGGSVPSLANHQNLQNVRSNSLSSMKQSNYNLNGSKGSIGSKNEISSDDEDAELLGLKKLKKKEMSLADFLKETEPPLPEPVKESKEPKKKGMFSKFGLSISKKDLEKEPEKNTEANPNKKRFQMLAIPADLNYGIDLSNSTPALNGPVDGSKPRLDLAAPQRRKSQPHERTEHLKVELAPPVPRMPDQYQSKAKQSIPRSASNPRYGDIKDIPGVVPTLPSKKNPTASAIPSPPPTPIRTIVLPPRRPVKKPTTVVPNKLDSTASISAVLQNLIRLDKQFESVVNAKIEPSQLKELAVPVFTKPEQCSKTVQVNTSHSNAMVQTILGKEKDGSSSINSGLSEENQEEKIHDDSVRDLIMEDTHMPADEGVVVQFLEPVVKQVCPECIRREHAAIESLASSIIEQMIYNLVYPGESVELHKEVATNTDVRAFDRQVQTENIRIMTEQELEQEETIEQLKQQQVSFLKEIDILRRELDQERKMGRALLVEKETYLVRFDRLARLSLDKLIDGLQSKLNVETDLYSLDQQFGQIYMSVKPSS